MTAHESAVTAAEPALDDLREQVDNRTQDEQAKATERIKERLDGLQREPLALGGRDLSR